VIDYHLHLWPHSESSVWFKLDQIADYCDEAARHGVTELALTEHTSRFRDVLSAVGPFWLRYGHEPTSPVLAEYLDFHARNSLEEYVTLAQRAKDEGLPVKIGLEVDYYADQMDVIAPLLAQYPFDVLIGSVHWLGTWQFDDYDVPTHAHEWTVRDVDQCWADYARAIEELAASKSRASSHRIPVTTGTSWPTRPRSPISRWSVRRPAGPSRSANSTRPKVSSIVWWRAD
jgi:histidinol-phosphatase (PHP family)